MLPGPWDTLSPRLGRGLSRLPSLFAFPLPSVTAENDFPTSFLIRINGEVLILSLKLLVKSECSEIAETESFLLHLMV